MSARRLHNADCRDIPPKQLVGDYRVNRQSESTTMKLRKLRARMIGERAIRASMNGHDAGGRCRVLRMLSAANTNSREQAPAGIRPGPFEAPPPRNGPGLALITGLLVVYPVFASVAIVIASFWFLGGTGVA